MRFVTERETFATALSVVERAAASRENVPILSGVLVRASAGKVELRATDLETTIAARLSATVEAEGERVVDARLFSAIVRKLAGSSVNVELEPEGTTMKVEAAGAHFSLVSVGAEDFPELPEITSGWKVSLPAHRFGEAIDQVRFAAAVSDQRPVLSGVLVEIEEQALRLVATDSSRLTFRELSLDEKAQAVGAPGLFQARVVVPARPLSEMARLCNTMETDGGVELILGERLARFESSQATITTRLIEGEFPPYRKVFLEDLPSRVRLSRQALLDAVQRAALLSRRGPAVVHIEVRDGELFVHSSESDVGRSEEKVEAAIEGPAFHTAYQAHFLEDVLKTMSSGELVIELGDPNRAGTVKIPGDAGYRYIVMPVRLG